jgi:tetratricopeptide (TPR) repeat protein
MKELLNRIGSLCSEAGEEGGIAEILSEADRSGLEPGGQVISREAIEALDDAIFEQDRASADELIRLIEKSLGKDLDPVQEHGPKLLRLITQWVDMSSSGFELGGEAKESKAVVYTLTQLDKTLRSLSLSAQAELPLVSVAELRFAQGMVALHGERIAEAIRFFSLIVAHAEELQEDHQRLLAAAYECYSRALARAGRYPEARQAVERALALLRAMRETSRGLEASFELTQAWSLFQEGRLEEALGVAKHARYFFEDRNDGLRLGVAFWTSSRILKRLGDYVLAEKELLKADELFTAVEATAARGRVLVRLAFLQHLIICKEQGGCDSLDYRLKRGEQFLNQAYGVLRKHDLPETWASYHRTKAYLRLDAANLGAPVRGSLEEAERAAAEALRIGEKVGSPLLAARAWIVDAEIAYAHLSSGKLSSYETSDYVERMVSSAERALSRARQIQNRRVLAKAWIWAGIAVMQQRHVGLRKAEKCKRQAQRQLRLEVHEGERLRAEQVQLRSHHGDNVWSDLRRLTRLISEKHQQDDQKPSTPRIKKQQPASWNLRPCKGFNARSVTSIELIEFEVSPQKVLLIQCADCGGTHSTDAPSDHESPVEAFMRDLTQSATFVTLAAVA